jgi:hypothetical protein
MGDIVGGCLDMSRKVRVTSEEEEIPSSSLKKMSHYIYMINDNDK